MANRARSYQRNELRNKVDLIDFKFAKQQRIWSMADRPRSSQWNEKQPQKRHLQENDIRSTMAVDLWSFHSGFY
jgi:hypothetical protein